EIVQFLFDNIRKFLNSAIGVRLGLRGRREPDIHLSRLGEYRGLDAFVLLINRSDARIECGFRKSRRSEDSSCERRSAGEFSQTRNTRFFEHRHQFRWRARQQDNVISIGRYPETGGGAVLVLEYFGSPQDQPL